MLIINKGDPKMAKTKKAFRIHVCENCGFKAIVAKRGVKTDDGYLYDEDLYDSKGDSKDAVYMKCPTCKSIHIKQATDDDEYKKTLIGLKVPLSNENKGIFKSDEKVLTEDDIYTY